MWFSSLFFVLSNELSVEHYHGKRIRAWIAHLLVFHCVSTSITCSSHSFGHQSTFVYTQKIGTKLSDVVMILPGSILKYKCLFFGLDLTTLLLFFRQQMHDVRRTIEYCERARGLWAQLGDRAAQMRCLHTLGDLERRSGNAAAAVAGDLQVIELASQLPPHEYDDESKDHVATAHTRIGSAAYEAKRWPEARAHFDKSLALREELCKENEPDKLLSDAYYWVFLVAKEMGDPKAKEFEAKSNACLPPS